MMNKKLWIIMICCIALLSHSPDSIAQTKVDTIELKEGEVLDLLLLRQNPDTKEALAHYFKSALPVAQAKSYQSIPGFRIKAHVQGNLQPEFLILGKWSDLLARQAFQEVILDKVPDFHEQRRTIWSYMGIQYFEMPHDLSLIIDRGRYHVATAYWLGSDKEQVACLDPWKAEIQQMGGEILVALEGGESPFGYQYDSDIFVITSWENEASFKAFQQKQSEQKAMPLKHVNEFILK